MDLRGQIERFRTMLEEHGHDILDFELNIDGDAFREVMAGGSGVFEVVFRITGVTVVYDYDGTPSWLDTFARDLATGRFGSER